MTDFSHAQLRQIDGDEIKFTPINTANDVAFYAPVPDWMPTDEEVAQAIEERRRDRYRDYLAELRTKD